MFKIAKFEFKEQYTVVYGKNAPSCDPLTTQTPWLYPYASLLFINGQLNKMNMDRPLAILYIYISPWQSTDI